MVQVKALACELPHRLGLPLSRFSVEDIRQEVVAQGLIAQISGTTIWRWLSRDALCPWRHRTWIFPRDPRFVQKASPILDLYQGRWDGQSLGSRDFVLSADEKTSIQARRRAWAYLAAWDVHRAKVFGRCETSTGIAPFDRLVEDVMGQEPYRSAHRVFWVFDNGSSHRGQKADQRLQSRWPSIIPVHTPVHASWLNQVEIYFSIIQRKVLTPGDFPNLADLEMALLAFQQRYERSAAPFRWTFTHADLAHLMQRLKASAFPAAA